MHEIFLNLAKLLIKIIICIPITLIIILIYPVLKVKIFEIETRAIGHFSRSIDIFLSELSAGIHQKKRTVYICFPNKRIANNFLLNKWKEKILIVPNLIFEPIFYFFKKIPFGSIFLAEYRYWQENDTWQKPWQVVDIHNVLDNSKPNLIFSSSEIETGNEYLKKNDVDINNYICLIVRSPDYYFRNKLIKNYKKSLRDSDLNNFLPALEFLSKKKYKIINLGDKNDMIQKKDNIIMYNNFEGKNEFNDIFIPYHCSFIISTGLGLDFIPLLNRKKRFLINFSEIFAFWSIDDDVNLVLPKKFKNLSTGEFIPYSDVLRLNLSNYNNLEDLNKKGYDCVSNTSEELLGAIEEIEYFHKKNEYLNKDMDSYNEKFRKIYMDHFGYKIKKTKICNSFLKINKDLIN